MVVFTAGPASTLPLRLSILFRKPKSLTALAYQPHPKSLRNKLNPRFRRSTSPLSTKLPHIVDPTSGVKGLALQTIQQTGNSLSIIDEQPVLPPGASGQVICRNVSLQHGSRYFSRVIAENLASPPVPSESRSPGFVSDDTPPIQQVSSFEKASSCSCTCARSRDDSSIRPLPRRDSSPCLSCFRGSLRSKEASRIRSREQLYACKGAGSAMTSLGLSSCVW